MSAYDELIGQLNHDTIESFRKKLISPQGMIKSGKLCEYMDLSSKIQGDFLLDDTEDEEPEKSTQVKKIFIRKSTAKSQNSGFVFDADGTETIIRKITNASDIKLLDLKDNFRFIDDKKSDLWNAVSEQTKKRLIFADMHKMKKDTDMQYRIHGSRLHYLAIGKMVLEKETGTKKERLVFPMFLFECEEMREKECIVSISQSGFMNFTLDEPRFFDGRLREWNSSIEDEIVIDSTFQTKLNSLKEYVKKLEIPSIVNIEFDPQFSMIGVITGFEAEYLDKAWGNILK